MKKLIRILSLIMVLSVMISVFSATVFAFEYSGHSSKYERTWYVYHTWGKAVKLDRDSVGTGVTPTGSKISSYGKYTYTVKDSNGKVVRSGNWFPDRTKTETLVKALAASGKYTITVSAVRIDRAGQSGWKVYPKYKVTY